MLVSIAWKNIWRNKKRSLIIIAAICFGLWGGLMSGSIMMGMGESMVTTKVTHRVPKIKAMTTPKTDDGTLLRSTALFAFSESPKNNEYAETELQS